MAAIGKYILSVVCAATIACICCGFADEKSITGALVRMVSGLFVVIVMLSPIARWNYEIIETWTLEYEKAAQLAAEQGITMASEATAQLISERTAAYILDKAAAMGAPVSVEVIMASGDLPVPESVRVFGNVSPYAKQQLVRIMDVELGIPKECQIWMG